MLFQCNMVCNCYEVTSCVRGGQVTRQLRAQLGTGRDTVSKELFRKGELAERCAKLSELREKLSEFTIRDEHIT